MRYLFILTVFAWHATDGLGQYLPNYNFTPLVESPCPYDPGTIIAQPEGWEIYQTTNGFWDGPRDSSVCVNVTPDLPFTSRLYLDQIKPSEPLFLRAQLENFFPPDFFLPADFLFDASSFVEIYPDTVPVVRGSDCPEGICTGLLAGIAIPDEAGNTGAALRVQSGLVKAGYTPFSVDVQTCFPTEYFPDQYFGEFILKFSFDSFANLDNHWLLLHGVSLYPDLGAPGYITEVVANPDNLSNGVYTVNVDQASGGGFAFSFLMRYTAPSYPDAQHPSWVDARPSPNTTDPQTIILSVEQYQTLEIQPFTGLRGGLVQGSDSIRHHAVLENNGGDFCFNGIDLIFGGGEEYRHAGGTISLQQARSCMQFRPGSALRVLDGATLRYGAEGTGMLMLCSGADVVLEKNATLVVDASLNLSDCGADPQNRDIRVDLQPGAQLIFTPKAELHTFHPDVRLAVHMLGGSLDDSALSAEEKALIRRVYPAPSPDFFENVNVAPNPFDETLTLRYRAGEEEKIRLSWIDAAGQTIYQETLSAARGDNEWEMAPPLPAGFYLLTIEAAGGKWTRKMVKVG